MADFSTLLAAARRGDAQAVGALYSTFYQELRRLARARLKRSANRTMLETTGLVHESYARLVQVGGLEVNDRAQFLAYAGSAMRSIVVDLIRLERSERAGGQVHEVTLTGNIADERSVELEDVLAVHAALENISKLDPRLVQVVELRYFAGLTEVEVAGALGLTERTVRRDWEKARALLMAALR